MRFSPEHTHDFVTYIYVGNIFGTLLNSYLLFANESQPNSQKYFVWCLAALFALFVPTI